MKNKNTGFKLSQHNKTDLQFLSEWIDLKTSKAKTFEGIARIGGMNRPPYKTVQKM